ncbi:MAG TPA: hypothetical protein VFZ70_17535 [Euzebyales bacterium]
MAYGLTVANVGTPANSSANGLMIAAYGVGLSALLIPFAFITVALISRREDWPLKVFYGMGLALVVGLPLLIFGNPLASLIAGYAAGAVITVSLPEGVTWHNRAIAAAVVTLLALGGMMVAFTPTAVIAPALPFTAVGVADLFGVRPTA